MWTGGGRSPKCCLDGVAGRILSVAGRFPLYETAGAPKAGTRPLLRRQAARRAASPSDLFDVPRKTSSRAHPPHAQKCPITRPRWQTTPSLFLLFFLDENRSSGLA
jgi:hypothetical protein